MLTDPVQGAARAPGAGRPSAGRPVVRHARGHGDCGFIAIENVPDYYHDFHVPRWTPSGRPVRRTSIAFSFQEVQPLIAAGKGAQPLSARAAAYHRRPDTAIVPVDDAPPVEYGLTWFAAAGYREGQRIRPRGPRRRRARGPRSAAARLERKCPAARRDLGPPYRRTTSVTGAPEMTSNDCVIALFHDAQLHKHGPATFPPRTPSR